MTKVIKEVKAKEVIVPAPVVETVPVVTVTPETDVNEIEGVAIKHPTGGFRFENSKRRELKEQQHKTQEEMIKVITDIDNDKLFNVTVIEKFPWKKEKPQDRVIVHGKALEPVMTGIPAESLAEVLKKSFIAPDLSYGFLDVDNEPPKDENAKDLYDLYVFKINRQDQSPYNRLEPIQEVGERLNTKKDIYQVLAIDSKSNFKLDEGYKLQFPWKQDLPELFDKHGVMVIKDSKLLNVVFSGSNIVNQASLTNVTLIDSKILVTISDTFKYPSATALTDAFVSNSTINGTLINGKAISPKIIDRSKLTRSNFWSSNLIISKSSLEEINFCSNEKPVEVIKSVIKKISLNSNGGILVHNVNYTGNGEAYMAAKDDKIKIQSIFDILSIKYSNDETINIVRTDKSWSANLTYNVYENLVFDLSPGQEKADMGNNQSYCPRPIYNQHFDNAFPEYEIAAAISKAVQGLSEWGTSVLTEKNDFTQEIIRHLSKTISDRIVISRKIASVLEVTYINDENSDYPWY